jgi:hypothetical protein
MRQNYYNTVIAYTQSYASYDISQILAIRTADCIHSFLSSSGETTRHDNASYREFYKPLTPVLKSSRFDNHKILVDEQRREATLWTSITIVFMDPRVRPFKGDFVFLFEFDESGSRIRRIREFVDRAGVQGYLKRLEEARRLATTRAPEGVGHEIKAVL